MSEMSGEGPELYHGYSVDDEDQPQAFGDSLADDRGLREPLDEGYSPPDRWSAGQRFGNTAFEELVGETLDQRLAQEEPDVSEPALSDVPTGRTPVGGYRAGHLLAYDPGPEDTIDERGPEQEEGDPYATAGDVDPFWRAQAGGRRTGRLVAYDEGVGEDEDEDLVAFDVGIDGSAASAEEAAMHLVEDGSWPES